MATQIKIATIKKWIHELDPKNLWLRYSIHADKLSVQSVYCDLCRKNVESIKTFRNYNASFVDGVLGCVIKKDNIVKHSKSEIHHASVSKVENKVKSLSDFYEKTGIGKAMTVASDINMARIGKLIDISYVIAKEEIAFSKFPKIIELEKRHGVDVGQMYHSPVMCAEFTECISEVFETDFCSELKKANYFTVFVDSSTDTSVSENEIIYIMYINEVGDKKFRFLTLKHLKSADANCIKNTIVESLLDCGIVDFEKKLVGFLADGANVNMGPKKGVAALLKKTCPWLVAVHCLSHRLELALKDFMLSTYFQDILKLMEDIHNYYEKSAKRIRDFHELSAILDEDVSDSPALRVHGTRWISHMQRALDTLIRNYTVIVHQLENMVADAAMKGEKAKVVGILRKIKSIKFVCWLLLLHNILCPLSKLSLSLQSDDVDMLCVLNAIEKFYDSIEIMKNKKFSADLSKILQDLTNVAACESNDFNSASVEFHSIRLQSSMSVDTFYKDCEFLLCQLYECVYLRLGDLHENPVFNAVKLLEPKIWPTDKIALSSFGDDIITVLTEHFGELLAVNNIEKEKIQDDWGYFKTFWLRNLQHLPRQQLWKCLKEKFSTEFPNLNHIINVIRLLPVSNAKVERAFSAMNRIKTDFRNRMSSSALTHLLRITLEGPELCGFQPERAADIFFKKKPRRINVKPYGKRLQPDEREYDCYSDLKMVQPDGKRLKFSETEMEGASGSKMSNNENV